MAQLSRHPTLAWVPSCALCIALCSSGCSESNSRADLIGKPFVNVTYQGKPLSDVQINLHDGQGGAVLAQSISGQDGNAYFTEVPSPEPPRYSVTVESIGDGGWMLNPEACQELSKITFLAPLESTQEQRIEIPAGAVQTLASRKRR